MQLFSHLQWWSNPATHLLQRLQCFVLELLSTMLHHWQIAAPSSGGDLVPKSSQSLNVVVTIEQNNTTRRITDTEWIGTRNVDGREGIWIEWIKKAEANRRNHPTICWVWSGHWKPCFLFHCSTLSGLTWLFNLPVTEQCRQQAICRLAIKFSDKWDKQHQPNPPLWENKVKWWAFPQSNQERLNIVTKL